MKSSEPKAHGVTAPLLNSGGGLLKLMHKLESLRSQMVICAVEMQLIYGDDFQHSKELMGASDMVQDWIKNIREEI